MPPQATSRAQKYYDAHADVYDRLTGFESESGHWYNFRRYYEPMLEEFVPRSGRVLELGCGTGFYTQWLMRRGLDVVAMDISERMIERARRRLGPDASLHVGDCQDPAAGLGADAGRFDSIVGINTFAYYAEKAAALANYRELLGPGGHLVFLDMNGSSYTQQIAYATNYRGARRFRATVDDSTPERLEALLVESGYRLERMKRFSFVPNVVGRVGTSLFGPVDRILSALKIFDRFAIRLFWVARRL